MGVTRMALISTISTMSLLPAGCAGGRHFDTRNVDSHLTPATVAASDYTATRVVGGRGDRRHPQPAPLYGAGDTLLPAGQLAASGYDRLAQGRFLARYPHYLEANDYAPDRHITLSGTVEKVLTGKVGEVPYRFALIKADALYLWPGARGVSAPPQFHPGGVVFGG